MSGCLVAVLRRLAARARALARELAELDRELKRIVSALAPELLDQCGVGPSAPPSSSSPAATQHGWKARPPSPRSPAHQPSRGLQRPPQRHRLNRGGDRRLNRALHVIALNRIRCHPETRAYYQKLLASGKTPREARRCVKRMLARHFHRQLRTIPALHG